MFGPKSGLLLDAPGRRLVIVAALEAMVRREFVEQISARPKRA